MPADRAGAREEVRRGVSIAFHMRSRKALPGGEFKSDGEEFELLRGFLLAATAAVIFATPALADPIEGTWQTKAGSHAVISPCGKAYCIKLTTGEHAGMEIGKMTPTSGGAYTGTITDPGNGKTYNGKGAVSGNSLSLKGCVLGGLICRGETWKRL